MTSLRHTPQFEEGVEKEPKDAYLDAARDCILDVGWRRTTLTEVARRAGVSRMTIYRTWGDMPTLLGDLMTREWAGVVTEQVTDGGPAIQRPAMKEWRTRSSARSGSCARTSCSSGSSSSTRS